MTNEEAKRRGYQLEADVKELIRGKLTPGSGSGNVKGDVKSVLFLCECKFKSHEDAEGPYLDLDLQWLEAIWRHARDTSYSVERIPLLALEWADGTRFFLMPLRRYQELNGQTTRLHGHYYTGRKARLRVNEIISGAMVKFDLIEVPEPIWVFVGWSELFHLRKENQPVEAPPKRRWKSRGFRR